MDRGVTILKGAVLFLSIVAAETEFGMRLNINEIGNLKDIGELTDFIVERATK